MFLPGRGVNLTVRRWPNAPYDRRCELRPQDAEKVPVALECGRFNFHDLRPIDIALAIRRPIFFRAGG
jgi:hypothetical protein